MEFIIKPIHEGTARIPRAKIVINLTAGPIKGLTHWGLVTPYGDRDLGQHLLR